MAEFFGMVGVKARDQGLAMGCDDFQSFGRRLGRKSKINVVENLLETDILLTIAPYLRGLLRLYGFLRQF
ncbi:hypothetical protein [Pseudocalidococcus azoricus]|uniref:hypothetical protein n=1 Tax=Pseudocalidococcus azoricus TaxID=3110322 RepID=UPI002AF6C122|nr:hypothetical protein [Pseudocalidococcus azoricus]